MIVLDDILNGDLQCNLMIYDSHNVIIRIYIIAHQIKDSRSLQGTTLLSQSTLLSVHCTRNVHTVYYTVIYLYCTRTVLYCNILCTILYYTVLYCVIYCTILCNILCNILYSSSTSSSTIVLEHIANSLFCWNCVIKVYKSISRVCVCVFN